LGWVRYSVAQGGRNGSMAHAFRASTSTSGATPRVDRRLTAHPSAEPAGPASCTLPAWKLIVAGKVYRSTRRLRPAHTGGFFRMKTWRETLRQSLADYGYHGHCLRDALPSDAWFCCMIGSSSRALGWKPPQTWDSLTSSAADSRRRESPPRVSGQYAGGFAWPHFSASISDSSRSSGVVMRWQPSTLRLHPIRSSSHAARLTGNVHQILRPGAMR